MGKPRIKNKIKNHLNENIKNYLYHQVKNIDMINNKGIRRFSMYVVTFDFSTLKKFVRTPYHCNY